MKALSLFSNIGVAEAYLEDIGVEVVLANELIPKRAKLYSEIYPKTKMICGDIINSGVFAQLIEESKERKVDVIIATPPCQGASRAGKQIEGDIRNTLIIPVINIISELKPQYVFFENVPQLLETKVHIDGQDILIPDLMMSCLAKEYDIDINLVDTKDYSVPQTRERTIILMTRNGVSKKWRIPEPDGKLISLEAAIGNLPMVDPKISDVTDEELVKIFPHFYERKAEALKISRWHNPPKHIKRQVITMMHTPTGCTAFDNKKFIPLKENGEAVRGYKSTYRRLRWKDPASTVTMDNRKISSQNNVHPGRFLGLDENNDVVYSDPRALTVYELMRVMSLPDDWPLPNETPEAFLRSVIGEGIPPLFIKKVFEKII